MSDKVINLSDKMQQRDSVKVTEPVEEHIDLTNEDGKEIINLLARGAAGGDLSDKDREMIANAGLTEEEFNMTTTQYKEYQKQTQTRPLVGEVLGYIVRNMSEEEKALIPNFEGGEVWYDELENYILDTMYDAYNEALKAVYQNLAEILIGILKKDKVDPIVKPEDRSEAFTGPVNYKLYDIAPPGTKYIYLNQSFIKSVVQDDKKIDDNRICFQLLEFIMKSVVMETSVLSDKDRRAKLLKLAKTNGFLDSIAIGKIADYLLEQIINDNKDDIAIIKTVTFLFPAQNQE